MSKTYLGLDVGQRRIGVAVGANDVRAAWPLTTVLVDGTEKQALAKLVADHSAAGIVVGRPLNQAGEPTAQTKHVEDFVAQTVAPLNLPVLWQEESVTSVMAEERLKALGAPYDKAAIDAMAASIILQDFLENE